MSMRYTRCATAVTALLVLLLLLAAAGRGRAASLSLAEQKKYKQLIEGQGLYGDDDGVEVLTANNFKSKVYGQKHAAIVEFYNSWCGFCQRFAPSWKALAQDVKGWKHIVTVAAIDCSDEDNSPICRDFEIMSYPTLRYFHEQYAEGPKQLGVALQKGADLDALRQGLVRHMMVEQSEGRGTTWPRILPSEIQAKADLFGAADDKGVRYAFMIVADPTFTTIPAEVALDMSRVKEATVLLTLHNNSALLTSLNVRSVPALLAVETDLSVHTLTPDAFTREALNHVIKLYLEARGIKVTDTLVPPGVAFRGNWIRNHVPDIGALFEAREQAELKLKVRKMGNAVFQMDLETALRFSLKHEVATVKLIEGEKLTALRNYLDVILAHFPLGAKGRQLLQEVRTSVADTQKVRGADIQKLLAPIDDESQEVFSTPQKWLGCAGSEGPRYRGYPCGMWTMFHYLTVQAAEAKDSSARPRQVLDAMLGYVKHYFGCEECSQHFQEMALNNDMHSVQEGNSAVIWLWLAHNQVNKRLAGDPTTDDPDHPKVQFPAAADCPRCRDGDKWNLPEVLTYLRHMYSSVNVRYLGANTRVLLNDGRAGDSTNRAKRSTAVSSGSTWVLINRMDVSLCFVLYVLCFLLLLVIVRLFLKKNYKKKMYVHDILGKV